MRKLIVGVDDSDDAPGPQELEDQLVVGVVVGLVGIDEGKVEGALLVPFVQEILEEETIAEW